jgi:hypothetical protein
MAAGSQLEKSAPKEKKKEEYWRKKGQSGLSPARGNTLQVSLGK